MKKFLIQSIGAKIIFFYVLLALINVSFVIFIIFENQVDLISENSQLKYEQQFSNLVNAAKQFSSEMKKGTLFGRDKSLDSMDRFIDIIKPYAPKYAIITEDNRILRRSKALYDIPATLAEDMMRAVTVKNFSGKDYYIRIDEKKKSIYCYILLSGPHPANNALLVVKDMRVLDESLRNLYHQALFVIVVVLLFHGMFALALFRYIINPLKELNRGAQKLSRGDYGARILLPDRNDELGSLAHSINTMADSVSVYMKKLSGDVAKANQLRKKTDKLTVKDELTGMFNGIYMLERIKEETVRAGINKSTPALLLIIIDAFNEISAIYGPKSGDIILLEASKIIRKNCADTDIVSRFGLDNFAVLSPDASVDLMKSLSEKLRSEIEKKTIITPDGQFSITVCIGVSIRQSATGPDTEKENDLLSSAEIALSRAKQAGKNKVYFI